MSTRAPLSTHFSVGEFACKHCGLVQVNSHLVDALERLRDVGYPSGLTIVSGYRCKAHNAAVGGASQSQHRHGTAADIPARLTVDQVKALGVFSGIGWQWEGTWPRRRKVVRHVDVRHAGPHNPTGGSTARPTMWKYAS
jgi:hypothetical protein